MFYHSIDLFIVSVTTALMLCLSFKYQIHFILFVISGNRSVPKYYIEGYHIFMFSSFSESKKKFHLSRRRESK